MRKVDQRCGDIVEAVCRSCALAFSYTYTAGRLRLLCSDECRTLAKGRRAEEVSCRTCQRSFRPRYDSLGFCSRDCRRFPDRRIWSDPAEAKRAHEHSRRARKQGADAEKISSAEIFDRDGWRCGICGEKVDRRLKYPHPRSASLDHIVPLAKGGHHRRSNVQCSHWICNSRKTFTGGGQLRLEL